MNFLNKVVVITGAGSGIGKATAARFAKASAKLALVDIRDETVRESADDCAKISGQKVVSIVADVTKKEDVERIVATTLKEMGGIDVLVPCAGIMISGGSVTDMNIMEIFDKVLSVNLRSVLELMHVAAPALIESKGNVVVVSSETSVKVFPTIPYPVSKAALSHLVRCAALDLAPKGVRVNAVVPGPIITNLAVYSGMGEQVMNAYRAYVERLPLDHKTETQDVAELIFFLASDTAKAITGVNYPVDSGSFLLY